MLSKKKRLEISKVGSSFNEDDIGEMISEIKAYQNKDEKKEALWYLLEGVLNPPNVRQQPNQAAQIETLRFIRLQMMGTTLVPQFNEAKEQNYLLDYAIVEGKDALVDCILEEPGINLDNVDSFSETFLLKAISNGVSCETIEKLITPRSLTAANALGGRPLKAAQERGHHEIIELLQRKIEENKNPPNNHGFTINPPPRDPGNKDSGKGKKNNCNPF